jgi:hypothetical protein
MRIVEKGRFGFAELDVGATALASSVYETSRFTEFVKASGWRWDTARSWTILPADLCEGKLPDPGWSLWEELPRKVSQHEIDTCGALADRWIVTRARGIDSGLVLFVDPIARRQVVHTAKGRPIEPFDERHYLLRGGEINRDCVFALLEHCGMQWAGGAVIGSCPSLPAGQTELTPGMAVTMEAFAFYGFDNCATIIVTGADEVPSL